ncbi:MAG: CapA family protein [Desulfotomaculales bacterium]
MRSWPKFLGVVVLALLYLVVLGQAVVGLAEPTPPGPGQFRVATVHLAAAGDFLMHLPVVQAAWCPVTGGYDFTEIFLPVAPHLSEPDLTLVNLETRLAGSHRGYSGYPLFNSPAELARDMKKLGIDLVATANNHSLDMGVEGVGATLHHLRAAGLIPLGTCVSEEEAASPVVCEVKGIRIGFLNYTQSLNGFTPPPDRPYLVGRLDDEERISTDLERLRGEKVDLVVAYLHFGTEYQRRPDDYQLTVVRRLVAEGVDVVLGSHPHVVQPMESWSVLRDGYERPVFVIYSLGNFVSNQRWRHSDCGIILNLWIEKELPSGLTRLKRVDYVPVWVHRFSADGRLRYRVLPAGEALARYERGEDPLLTREDYGRLRQVREDITSLLGPPLEFGVPRG